MRIKVLIVCVFLIFSFNVSSTLGGWNNMDSLTISEKFTALMAYEKGFAKNVMRSSEGVRLFDMDLLEDDSPGAGWSEKGSFLQPIYGNIILKKNIYISDIRTNAVYLLFLAEREGSKPLTININGNETIYKSETENSWKTLSFNPSWLKKGENTILISCPEGTKKDLWKIMIGRKDEFERGGGDPSKSGLNSFVSTDGGKKWGRNILGETSDVEGELTVRLSFDRFMEDGWLVSPVIDLWRNQSDGFMIPQSVVNDLRLACEADVPKGTSVIWQVRSGEGPDPLANYWSEYKTVGEGEKLSASIGNPGRRYFQWKAVLKTSDPRITPEIHSVIVERKVLRINPLPENIYVLNVENPEILYSSLYGEYEKYDEPKLKQLRERERLDDITTGSKTQFEMLVKLCDYVSKRWDWVPPYRQYPSWDAIEILDRIEKEGGGGMCIHFAIVFIQAVESFGFQARLQNVYGHEVTEVWSDDYGKWVFFDPMQGSNIYNYSKKNGEPLGFKEIHKTYLDIFYPNSPINWDLDKKMRQPIPNDAPIGAGTLDKNWPRSDASDGVIKGLYDAAVLRMMPRSNWMAKHNPSPLGHGLTEYPWNGYINWYDDRTPRMRNQKNFTDREADYWPILNRVKMYASTSAENDRMFLRFTTFTPDFDKYLVKIDEGEWVPTTEYFPWILHSGLNKLEVRIHNKAGVLGKPSIVEVNLADRPNLLDRGK